MIMAVANDDCPELRCFSRAMWREHLNTMRVEEFADDLCMVGNVGDDEGRTELK